MKKLSSLSIITLIMSSLVSLASCHGAKDSVTFEVPETFDSSKEYNITFWAKNDSNLEQKTIYQETIAKFNEFYPNIHVTLVSYTDYQEIYNDVVTNIATSTTPNVCISYPDHVATYLEGKNVVAPLETLATNKKYGFGGSEVKYNSVKIDDIYSKFLDEGIIDGSYYTLPYMRSSEACYINKDYVNKLGYEIPEVLTWDFVWEVSSKAMELKEANQTLIPMIYKSTDNMFIQAAYQLGINYSDTNGNIGVFTDSKTKDYLLELQTYNNAKLFDTFKRVSYPGNYFNAGQCIFAIDSTAGSTWMGSNCPLLDIPESSRVNFETVVKEIPQYDTNNIKMISQGPSICLFNKEDNQEVLASFLFAQFLLTDEVQVRYAETEGYIPVTKSATESEAYKDYLAKAGQDNDKYYDIKIEASKLVTKNIENTFTTPVFNGSSNLRYASGALIENIFKKKYKGEENYQTMIDDTIALYKIDQIVPKKGNILLDDDGNPVLDENGNVIYLEVNTVKLNLGKLPATSKALLISILCVWVLLGGYYLYKYINKKIK